MKGITQILTVFIFFSLSSTGQAHTQFFNRINKMRSSLDEKGVVLEAAYTLDYFANTKGGLKRDDTYLTHLDLILTLDTKRLGLWDHGTFRVNMIDNSGGEKFTGDILGDTQGVSNIEAPRTTRIYELWYEHVFFEDKLSVLGGIHDYNSEFDVTEYGGLYVNSSFGIGPEISKNARPSIFPLTAPAIRAKIIPNDQWQFLFGVYDGDPGDPNVDEHFPRSDFDHEGGAFIATEAAYHLTGDVLPGFIKLGMWHNTGEFNHVTSVDNNGVPIKRDGNTGGYLVVDKMLYREDVEHGSTEQGLGAFLQLGSNKKYVNEVNMYIGGGLNYRGLIPGRDQDEIGLAFAQARINDDLVDAGGRKDHETSIELTYKAQITEHISIQPDFQYVIDPGAVSNVDDAFVVGARFEMAL